MTDLSDDGSGEFGYCWWHWWEAWKWARYALLLLNMLTFISLVRLFAGHKPYDMKEEEEEKRAVVVTSHPDDEAMFFAPFIGTRVRTHRPHSLRVLCLSTGNVSGLGSVRREEFYRACKVLGVAQEDADIIDHPRLQDGMNEQWDVEIIADLVAEYVQKHSIQRIVTFDEHGVSLHPNHVATYEGVRQYLKRSAKSVIAESSDSERKTLRKRANKPDNTSDDDVHQQSVAAVEGYALRSTNLLRKYLGVLDLFVSLALQMFRDETFFYLTPSWQLAYCAMRAHHSQFVWFRRLFIVFSRYAYVNTLRPIS